MFLGWDVGFYKRYVGVRNILIFAKVTVAQNPICRHFKDVFASKIDKNLKKSKPYATFIDTQWVSTKVAHPRILQTKLRTSAREVLSRRYTEAVFGHRDLKSFFAYSITSNSDLE